MILVVDLYARGVGCGGVGGKREGGRWFWKYRLEHWCAVYGSKGLVCLARMLGSEKSVWV